MFLCLQEVIFSCVYRWWYSVVFISRNILVCLQAEIFCCVYRQWLWRTPLSGCPLTQPGTIVGGLGVTWSAFTVLERTRLSRILSGKCIFCINIIMPGISLCFSLFILAIFSKKQILFEKKNSSHFQETRIHFKNLSCYFSMKLWKIMKIILILLATFKYSNFDISVIHIMNSKEIAKHVENPTPVFLWIFTCISWLYIIYDSL